jgi:hypothetical protein
MIAWDRTRGDALKSLKDVLGIADECRSENVIRVADECRSENVIRFARP